jgi:hypothetical protein
MPSRRTPAGDQALRNGVIKCRWLPFALVMVGVSFGSTRSVSAEDPRAVAFNRDIRPILSDKCFACHGFDQKTREADLRLDTREGATESREGGAAIVPGDPETSLLLRRIHSEDPAEVMPPPDTNKRLTDNERNLLKRWIAEGANYERHWAFEPPTRPAVPMSGESNPIDAFIRERLAQEGLKRTAAADKEVLLRRVAFALSGLPPTAEQTDQFLRDDSPHAYERLVDSLMASPLFGEEMARHWLDVARYADTHGMHLDNERQTWAYRDWVIDAFNRNLPFDRFTIEQLAGDLLHEPTADQLVATGFNRCNVTTSEGGSINEELLFRYAIDRTSTTVQAWLGLTAGCAVCHDHKFDPLTQADFYSLYAFFNSAADPGMDGNSLLTQPVLKLYRTEDQDLLAAFDRKIAEAEERIEASLGSVEYTDPAKVEPRPEVVFIDDVWMEDGFPPGGKLQASPGAPTEFITRGNEPSVFSGERSLKRTDAGLAQDVWDQAESPLKLPGDAVFFAEILTDPANPPRAVMLQYFKDGWQHRAVWGDYDAIPWGAVNTTERVHMGPLPAPGQWQHLEVAAGKIGLAAGDLIRGFALTQFGGTVYWDRVGVKGKTDPTSDPSQSFLAWWRHVAGKDNPALPADLRPVAQGGPDKSTDAGLEAKLKRYYLAEVCATTRPRFAKEIADRDALKSQRQRFDDSIPSTFVFKDLPAARQSFVMMRGGYDKPGDRVEPRVPTFLPPLRQDGTTGPPTRLDLAKWLVSDKNPLTSRVTVNRFWQQLFGTGLVKTSYDFGSQGELPSHAELLDWLSVEFRDSDWDMKRLIRLMVCSETFRQSSRATDELIRRDPENRLYARGPRFRLDAEQIRDNALTVSGLAVMEMGGKGVKPYQPDNIWEPVGFAGSNTRFYQRDSGQSLYRRSIYTFYKRTAPPPYMVNFDAPNREQFCTMRERSNTPLQALQLMNDVQYVEASRALATRMIREGGETFEERLAFAYRVVLARSPSEYETRVLAQQFEANLAHYKSDQDSAKKLITQGETQPDAGIDVGELAAFTLIANTLLNLDETLTRN